MTSKDFIAMILFTWACALLASACVIALGVPWDYALTHTLSACFIGTSLSFLLTCLVERWVRRIEIAQGVKP